MQYNTTREKLIKPEYGRHIQNMVQHAMTLSSKEERTKCAKAIVSFLVQSNNVSPKNIEEAEKKYWASTSFSSCSNSRIGHASG